MGKIGIEMTSVTDKAVGLKLPVVALEDLLNEHTNLSDYGTGVEKIFFVFIAVPTTNTIHEEHIIYTESERHLEIAARLDYDTVLKADSEECMKMMKGLFLEALKACYDLKIGDFDWIKLIAKLEKI